MHNIKKEKIVGILGGMGPYATLDLYKKILEQTPAKKDWEHLRLLIDNNVKIPSRTRSILHSETSPTPLMIESINNLAKIGADFVAVPCNSAHYFYDEVKAKIKIPWLNMIKTVAQKVLSNKPLIIGGYITVKKKLYSRYKPNAIYLSDTENDLILKLIEEIKVTSKLSSQSNKHFHEIIKKYTSKVDTIILACTELPIVYHEIYISNIRIIDANLEYAKSIIEYARS